MRKIGEFLLARDGNAALVAFLFTLLPLLGVPGGFIALIIVGFVTLCRGPRSGLFVLIWVALPAIALLYLRRFSILDILLLRCVLVWLLAYALRRLGSWRAVFEVATVIGVLSVIGVHLFVPDIEAWWTLHLTKFIADVGSMTSWQMAARQTELLVKMFAPMATGVTAFIVLFGSWLLLFLARWWQTTIYYPGRLQEEFIGIRNHVYMACLVLVGFIGVVMKWPLAIDVFPVLLLPLMMGGLSFLHFVSTIKKGFVLLVVLSYAGLLLFPFLVVVLLALAGFFDIWFDFRKYLNLKGDVA